MLAAPRTLGLKHPFERHEVVEVVFVGDAGVEFALIDEDGAARRAFGELQPADFFLYVGDAGMVDAAAELDLDDVERLLRA